MKILDCLRFSSVYVSSLCRKQENKPVSNTNSYYLLVNQTGREDKDCYLPSNKCLSKNIVLTYRFKNRPVGKKIKEFFQIPQSKNNRLR